MTRDWCYLHLTSSITLTTSGEDEAHKLLSQLSSYLSIADCLDKDKFTLACYNGWYNVANRLLHLACLGGNKDLIASLPGAKPK